MINGVLEFFSQLADKSIIPLVVATAVGAVVIVEGALSRNDTHNGTPQFIDARWRQLCATQCTLIAWFAWLLIDAVPNPNYQYKEVIKRVPVSGFTKYETAYDACRENLARSNIVDAKKDKICDQRAKILTFPNLKYIVRQAEPKVVTKVVYRDDPYITLYRACHGAWEKGQEMGWSVDSAENDAASIRQERIQICHRQALEAREAQLAQ